MNEQGKVVVRQALPRTYDSSFSKSYWAIMQVLFHPTAGHGGFILDTKWRQQILVQVETVIANGAEGACK